MSKDDKLGPLPEMSGELWELKTPRGRPPFRYFTADDLRAYAAQQVAAERERCAALCEAHAGMRGTGAWTVLTAAAARIRDPERAKRDAAPDSGD